MKFPDLSQAKAIGFDIETDDPYLLTKGPGVYRDPLVDGGSIVGFSLATPDGFAEYYDVAHPGRKTVDPDKVLSYLKEVMALPCPKVGANLLYDVDWTQNGYDIPVNGPLYDVQIAEALIDENQGRYSLDFLAQKYGFGGKNEDTLYQWCQGAGLLNHKTRNPGKIVKGAISKMPYDVVRPYGISDADLPLKIFRKQWPELSRKDPNGKSLLDVWELECKVLRVLLKMRKNGVPLNRSKLEQLIDEIASQIPNEHDKLAKIAGRRLNPGSFKQVKEWFEEAGIEAPTKEAKDASGKFVQKVSFDSKSLESVDHPIAAQILHIRMLEKLHGTFLTKNMRDMICPDGRIHGSFHPLKSDTNGTVTGRLSSSAPNLQQLPNPEKNSLFSQVRQVFIPEPDCDWGKIDYSQIEVRVLGHFAVGAGAQDFRDAFTENPLEDYHSWTAAVIAGMNVEDFKAKGPDFWKPRRKTAKGINFGLMYSMGLNKLKRQLGVPEEEGNRIIESYREALPFVMITNDRVKQSAERLGYIRTIGGRKRRFPDRRFAYKALNALIQGSAADVMKKAMVDLEDAGIFDAVTLHLTVHDELDVSIPKTKEGREAFSEMKRIMETALPLRVPTVADAEIGPNWADLEDFNE